MRETALGIIIAGFVALGLASCGGGGSSDPTPSPVAFRALEAKVRAPDPTLRPSPVAIVNTTTEGDQVLRSLGATSDGGYTVAWISDSTLYMQHYDRAGVKKDGETPIAFTIADSTTESTVQATTTSSMAVLTDGSVVVAYLFSRPAAPPYSDAFVSGVYIQRFDASGAQVLPESEVARSALPTCGFRCISNVGQQQVRALADGSFVVGWVTSGYLGTGVTLQRYDAQGQREGAGGQGFGQGSILGYSITPDARGGFTLGTTWMGMMTSQIVGSTTHYDAGMQHVQGFPERPISAVSARWLLLPLEDGYVLFSGGEAGATRQMLDSAGNPVGEAVAIPAFPDGARDLSDGTYVLIWKDGTAFSAQRFTPDGAALGRAFPIQADVGSMAPLTEPGFALAWTATTVNGDRDVYAQRFAENPVGRRRFCLDAAKEQKLKGQERKAFIDDCISDSGPP